MSKHEIQKSNRKRLDALKLNEVYSTIGQAKKCKEKARNKVNSMFILFSYINYLIN